MLKKDKVIRGQLDTAEDAFNTQIYNNLTQMLAVTFADVIRVLDSDKEQVFSDPSVKYLGLEDDAVKAVLELHLPFLNVERLRDCDASIPEIIFRNVRVEAA